jgi:predicted ABC-class ATPase
VAPTKISTKQHILPDSQHLLSLLNRLDGRGYKAYGEIRGSYAFDHFTLCVDHVQGDPFAAPSRLRVRVPQALAGYPAQTYRCASRQIALCTYLAFRFAHAAAAAPNRFRSGSGKSGLIEIDEPGQQMLDRTCVRVDADLVEARFCVGLPASGRRVLGCVAAEMLCQQVPDIVEASLRYSNDDPAEIDRFIRAGEDADALRDQLADLGLVAFVADDSVLPRRSGIDDRPLDGGGRVVRFRTPAELRRTVELPNAGAVSGMGIPPGVTLIVGGGFHGKSTLLNALERGAYNHIPADGRELVVTEPSAVSIRAEDGRCIQGVDLSPFIHDLPLGRDTRVFCTDNASGSTSQAANIIEALEIGSRLLLVDEDTAATNFMIRDASMQRLIARADEPITPFIDRVRQLFDEHGVSTVLVMGGSGDYFRVADTVIAMESYLPRDATAEAHAIAADSGDARTSDSEGPFGKATERIPLTDSIDTRKGRREVSVKTRGRSEIIVGTEAIDLTAVAQIVDPSQTRAIAAALVYARERYMGDDRTLREVLDAVMADITRQGLDVLSRYPAGDHAAFRRHEFAAALNRLRPLRVRQT